MDTADEKRSVEEILTTIAQIEYRNHKAVQTLSDEVSELNVLLGRVSRRLWAQNLVAWIQLVTLAVIVVIWVVIFVAMLAGVPVGLRGFGFP